MYLNALVSTLMWLLGRKQVMGMKAWQAGTRGMESQENTIASLHAHVHGRKRPASPN